MAARKIILYTNLSCPWAHRAHIALRETGLDFEQVLIDLDTPREPWYLEINPAGLVPSLSYNGNIITESAIVAQFIADAHPSHLLPPSGPADNALYRARIRFFIDAFFPKVQVAYMKCIRSSSEAEREEMTQEMVAAIKKGIEPLLEPKAGQGKGPFFGGSEKLTLAEVQCGSFLIRMLALAKPEHGLVSTKLPTLLEQQAPRFKRWAEATSAHESVNYIFNEQECADRMRRRFAGTSSKV